MTTSLCRLENLDVVRDERSICSVTALQIPHGDRLVIQGPNGSGKTTLLRVLAGLEQNFDGRCDVDGAAKRIYVHQQPYMLRGSVLDNVMLGGTRNGGSRDRELQQASELITRIGLKELAQSPAARLSGGEQRRVAIVRALAASPDLLLLDEPFADLDETGSTAVLQLLATRPEMTVVIAAPGLTSLAEARVHRLGG